MDRWLPIVNFIGVVASLVWTGIRCLIDKARWKRLRMHP
jgi:hypothetical protein